MKLSNLFLVLVGLSLAGCKSFGPAKITVQSNQDAVLEQPSKKRQVRLAANVKTEVKVSGEKDEVEFKFADTKIKFSKPVYNKEQGTVTVAPDKSGVTLNGQKAGLFGLAKLVDQKREVIRERRDCRYYETECRPVCRPTPNGGTTCFEQCFQRERYGWETVEHEDTYSTYDYSARIITEQNNTEVAGRGLTTFIDRRTTTIFRCF